MKFTLNLILLFSIVGLTTTTNAIELETRQYDDNSGDFYETVDGTVFKTVGYGYVGYMGYHQEIIFLSQDEVCMNGDKHDIKILEVGSNYHYSITSYSGAEAYEKFEEICGG